MTKAEIKFIRALFQSEISDEEAAILLEQMQEFTKEIKDELRQVYDPKERP